MLKSYDAGWANWLYSAIIGALARVAEIGPVEKVAIKPSKLSGGHLTLSTPSGRPVRRSSSFTEVVLSETVAEKSLEQS